MSSFVRVLHIAIVVRDMTTSVSWYERVLGFERRGAVMPGPPDAGHPRQIMAHPDSGLVLAVHEPVRRSDDLFDPNRTGLDHVALSVDSFARLDEWERVLRDQGVAHQAHEVGKNRFIALHDPDGIAWELWAVR